MNNEQKEIERLRRLRAQQIGTRNPYNKNDRVQKRVSTKFKSRSKYTWRDALRDMPAKFTYAVVGALIGLAAGIIIVVVAKEAWTQYLLYGLTGFGLMGGFAVGDSGGMGRYGEEA